MKRYKKAFGITRWIALSLVGVVPLSLCRVPSAAAQVAYDSAVYLDQGWSQADREMFYQISQGSRAISYDIFLALEVAGGRELFRSDQNSERYGLIPQAVNQRTNPDGLPIGIAKSAISEGRWAGPPQVGVTCAACHTGQLTYSGKRIRIDGGHGNTFDFMAYIGGLDDALQSTLSDPAKFNRLAARLGASSKDAESKLHVRLESDASRVHQYRTRALVTPSSWGPGRIDAIAAIVNRLVAFETGIPENFSTPLAPTKIPFLWNSPQGTWTQWRGVQQDPIRRNEVEAMGVFIDVDLHSTTPEDGLFDSTELPLNLERIEAALGRLAPPKWPEEILGKIDRKKASEGKSLFVSICAGCHNVWPYTWTEPNKYGKRFVRVGLIPQTLVGTDPAQFEDLRPYVITGKLSPQLPPPYKEDKYLSTGILYNILQEQILAKSMTPLKLTEAESAELHGYRELPVPSPPIRAYKAAPRDGVWATAPFLHNGSVPNIYEMLLPARERTKKFYVGGEFDPVRVGLDTNAESGRFLLDTSLPGNSNTGHSFENAPLGNGIVGPLLTDEQRWAIVEYLKSIPEEAGRVTPFGGPRE